MKNIDFPLLSLKYNFIQETSKTIMIIYCAVAILRWTKCVLIERKLCTCENASLEQ